MRIEPSFEKGTEYHQREKGEDILGREVGSDAFGMLEGQISNPSIWNVCFGAYLSKTDTHHLTQLCTISGHKR